VHLIAPGADRSALTMAIWERGAGVTEACGSGACAAASVAAAWDLCDTTVEVLMPGGAATIAVGETIALTGPASYIASIELPSSRLEEIAAEVTHG